MKKIIFVVFPLLSLISHAQQDSNQFPLVNYVWQIVGNPGFSAGSAAYLSFAFNAVNNQPYVAYADGSVSSKATVMRFDGTNWVNVGSTGFSAGSSQFISLAISPSGQPYVAYADWGNSKRTTVMKFDGTNWINVGFPGFSISDEIDMSLAFDSSGEPCVAYMDGAYSFRAVVKKFNGTGWVNVGNPGFSAGHADWINLAFNPVNQQPYVAYSDWAASFTDFATVMKFDGTNWVYVGNPNFSAGPTAFTSIAFNSSGEPYVAFCDDGYGSKARVMKFNGTSWINVGNPGFSPGLAMFTTLAFSPIDGLPYVAYIDAQNASKASLMKFDGSNWVYVGNGGFYAGADWSLGFEFSPAGVPYVAFADSVYTGGATVMKFDTICTVPPVPAITGSGNLCVNSGFYSYSTEPGMSNYQWNISPGGTITYGQGCNAVQVVWVQPGNQWISVNYINSLGCTSAVTTFPVTVDPLPDSADAINGSPVVCAGTADIGYSIVPVTNAFTYIWTLPSGASIISGNGTNWINVNFAGNAISGNITVYGNNICGNGTTSPPFYVNVNPVPATPIITENGDILTSSAPIGNQWYYNGILLVNDTSQNYLVSPFLPGYYWTQVTLYGCVSDTSNHIYYNTTGLNRKMESVLSLFPNPVRTNLFIEVANSIGPIKFVEIYELNGKSVFETQTDKNRIILNVEAFPTGIYFIKVKTETSYWIGKFCKD